ncbi:MAG: hypothetical protein QNK19_01975 [Xanthomonadales bacterium]|nr:hypothetical protein [Xanthomonadales bacterium]
MDIQVRQGRADSGNSQYSRFSEALWSILIAMILSFPIGLMAQVQEQTEPPIPETGQEQAKELAETPLEVTVVLPNKQQMAMALATPELREQALLDLAVAAHIVSRAEREFEAGIELDHVVLAQSYLDDRAWLQTLIDRHGWVQPHTSVLDPAAWLLIEELQQHDLENMPLLFPGHMPEAVLIYQVFQRSSQPLALTNLPNLLLEVEANVVNLWGAFLRLTEVEGVADTAWKEVETAWFTDRLMPPLPPVVEASSEDRGPWLENLPQAMSETVLSAVDARPPDSKGLIRLRYSILNGLPSLRGEENASTSQHLKDSLYLLSLIDGLHEGRYFYFVQGLLSVSFRLLEFPVNEQESFSLVNWLLAELPSISAHYAESFAAVDPNLNNAITAIYEVLLTVSGFHADDPGSQELDGIGSGDSKPAEIESNNNPANHATETRASRAMLADAVAQLALLIPDMAYYFNTPVRAKIVRGVNTCIGLAAKRDDSGGSVLIRRQFDSCMESLLQMADRETRLAELSGDMNGPFTNDTLRRELSVAPWQRINYAVGYLDDRFTTDCLPPANVLPNPLEWSVLANIMSWFGEHYPEFFDTTENENRISRMRNIGEEIVLAMVEQSECLAASGTGYNDLVSRIMTDYEIALRQLGSGISKAEAGFRSQRLRPGADVALGEDASQQTAYRPNDLVIAPCDARAVCEMSGNLSTTRALIGLFPDEYLLAEQTGFGHIEICYRNMEWVQRRSELVRADDENVANYFGHLGFDLVGRYVGYKQVSDIFGFRFTGPEEHHYLFAKASEEVLNDSCPVEWVGSRTITPLRVNRGGIVPNRLTYLAAARKLPSRLLQNNWDRGAEWRDWFVTGIGVESLELPATPDIKSRLNQHLQALYQAEQAEIYNRILLPSARNSQGDVVSLYDEMSEVSIAKAMLRTQMMLFYPASLFNTDSIRTAIVGDAGLLEQRTLRRFREDNVPMTSVNRVARERLYKFREDWSKQPEAVRRQASLPASLAYALTRINILYRQFFIMRPEVLQEIEVTVQPEPQIESGG